MRSKDIYTSGNLHVSARIVDPTGPVLIAFASGGLTRVPPGYAMSVKYDFNCVSVSTKEMDWFQYPDLPDAEEAIRKACEGFSRRVTYGFSMGAYGALLFSRRLGATQVLAFSPQCSISGDPLPIHPEWAKDMRNFPILYEPMADGISMTARVLIAFDSLNAVDLAHANAIEALRPCDWLRVPLSSHSTALQLQNLNLLKPIVLDALAGRLDPAAIRRDIRASRRNSTYYLSRLAALQKNRGRLASAARAEGMALDLYLRETDFEDEERHERVLVYLERLIAAGEAPRALAFAKEWALDYPSHPYGHVILGAALRGAGKRKAAAQETAKALQLKPNHAAFELRLVDMLLHADHLDGAISYFNRALKHAGATVEDWRRAALAFHNAGRSSEALQAGRKVLELKPKDAKMAELVARWEKAAAPRAAASS